jgi:hypothetical protein
MSCKRPARNTFGGNHAVTQAERQLTRHRRGTRRVIANPLSDLAQILEEGHGGHGHGQVAHIARADAHDGRAHRAARAIGAVGRGVRHPHDPGRQRRIGLDHFPGPIEFEVRMGNALDQFLHDRGKGPDSLECGHLRREAIGRAQIRLAGRVPVQPKVGHSPECG